MKITGTYATDTIRRLLLLSAGAFLFAAGTNGFFIPHKLLSTGVNGISLLVSYVSGLPVWLLVAVINAPLFILGFVLVSRRFFWLSLFGMAAITVFLWVCSGWDFGIKDPILAALAGGAVCGAGAGLMLRQGGSKGGIDIIAGMLNKKYAWSYNAVSNVFNLAIILVMAAVYGLESALLTLTAIFILDRVAEAVDSGFSTTITVLVLSRRKTNIKAEAERELGRRASVLQNIEDKEKPKEILMFIIQPRELARLKSMIFAEDCDAQVMLINTKEIHGKGFERKGPF